MVWQLQGERRPQAARRAGRRTEFAAMAEPSGLRPDRHPAGARKKSSPRWDCGYLGVVRASFRAAKVHSGRWMAREASGSRASGRWASLQVRIWYRSA